MAADNQYQLSEVERADIANRVKESLLANGGLLTTNDKSEIAGIVASSIASGTTQVQISDTDIANIVAEVIAQLKAESTDTRTLEKVGNLNGITSIPAVRNDEDIVSVPLGLLTTNRPIEVKGQEDIDILVAQGKIIESQLYFVPAEED